MGFVFGYQNLTTRREKRKRDKSELSEIEIHSYALEEATRIELVGDSVALVQVNRDLSTLVPLPIL